MQHLLPVEPHPGGCFIETGTDPFESGIKATFGHGQETVAVAPEQQGQRSQLPGATGEQQSQGQHRAGHGIAHAGQEREALQPAGITPALGDRQQQGCDHSQDRGGQSQQQAAETELPEVTLEVAAQLFEICCGPDQRCPQAQKRRNKCEHLGDESPGPLQRPGCGIPSCHAVTPTATAASQPPLAHHQGQHDHQGDQGQGDGAGRIAFSLPGLQDAGRQAGDAEELNSAQFVDDFHPHEGHTGSDRGQRDRQRDAPKGGPWSDAEAAAGLQLTPAAHRETFCAQQEHIGIRGKRHDDDPPGQAMDAPALATAQIHQRRRQQISRGGQGDQLSDAQPATTGKAAVDQQPAVGSTDQGASDGTAQQQPQRAADLKATIRTEAAETVTDALESLPEEVQHGPDGQQSKPRSCEAQQPTTHCQPLAAISSTALAFSSPSRWADTAAGWKGPQAFTTGLLLRLRRGYS